MAIGVQIITDAFKGAVSTPLLWLSQKRDWRLAVGPG
jgi:hypothetical protein